MTSLCLETYILYLYSINGKPVSSRFDVNGELTCKLNQVYKHSTPSAESHFKIIHWKQVALLSEKTLNLPRE